jgi:Tol biopolymer transport system component
MLKSANGTEAGESLLTDLYPKTVSDWSPDGKFLLYFPFVPATKEDLLLLPADGPKTPTAFLQTEFSETAARFSPDGRWVVYQSDESGRYEIYVRPFPTGSGKWQISANGGEAPIWSQDGKEIYYNQQGSTTMAVDVNGTTGALLVGTPRKLFDIQRSRVFDASPDGQRFLTIAVTGTQNVPPLTLITHWDKDLRKQ